MRRIHANKLIFATGIIVILMSALFALWRVSEGVPCANHDGCPPGTAFAPAAMDSSKAPPGSSATQHDPSLRPSDSRLTF